jgi:uroporphyrinogen-III synthase
MAARSSQGDAEALIALVSAEESRGILLHVRGAHARGDVARRLSDAGHPTREVVLYDQVALPLTDAAEDLLQRETPVIVPLFSPRGAAQFVAVHRGVAPLFVGAMSEAVAEAAAPLKARQTAVAGHPDAGAMLDLVAGLLDAACRLEAAQRDE